MNIQLNEIYNMDCLEGMRYIPDKSIDMILCDLPYGSTKNQWDIIIPFKQLWLYYERIIKDNGAIVLTASQPFTSMLVMSKLEYFKYSMIWEKSRATGHLNAKIMPMKNHEDILIFGKTRIKYNPQGILPYGKMTRRGNNGDNFGESGKENYQEFTNYPRTIIQFSNEGITMHPTQKPVELFEYLIKTYSNEGDTILDNCMGSGTTAIACMNTKRNFIGFELEKKYYDICIERINTRRNELSLDPSSV